MSINIKHIENEVRRLHREAKTGSLLHDGVSYQFNFNRKAGIYDVIGPDGLEVSFNTRKLQTAKNWFKDWLRN